MKVSLLTLALMFFLPVSLSAENAKKTSKSKTRTMRRMPRVTGRMLKLQSVESLHGDDAYKKKGIYQYRSMRHEIRNLVLKYPDVAKRETLGRIDGFVVDKLVLKNEEPEAKRRVLLVAGSHGKNEMASVEAALRISEELLFKPELLRDFEVTLVVGASPTAIAQQSSKNKTGQDFNKSFTKRGASREAELIQGLLDKEHFDMVLDLHVSDRTTEAYAVVGGYEKGFAKQFMRAAMPGNHLGRNKKKSGDRHFIARGVAQTKKRKSLLNWAYLKGIQHSYSIVVPYSTKEGENTKQLTQIVQSALKKR